NVHGERADSARGRINLDDGAGAGPPSKQPRAGSLDNGDTPAVGYGHAASRSEIERHQLPPRSVDGCEEYPALTRGPYGASLGCAVVREPDQRRAVGPDRKNVGAAVDDAQKERALAIARPARRVDIACLHIGQAHDPAIRLPGPDLV